MLSFSFLRVRNANADKVIHAPLTNFKICGMSKSRPVWGLDLTPPFRGDSRGGQMPAYAGSSAYVAWQRPTPLNLRSRLEIMNSCWMNSESSLD